MMNTDTLLNLKRWVSLFLVAAVTTQFLATQNSAFADEEKEVGLIGLIKNEPPKGIAKADFAKLPESWGNWSKDTIASLNKLYGFDKPTVEQQHQILQKLTAQLSTLDIAIYDPMLAKSNDEFINLGGKLTRRVALLKAVLATLQQNQNQEKELRPALKYMIEAIEGYETDIYLKNKTTKLFLQPDAIVRQQLEVLEAITNGNLATFQEFIRLYYYNFNVRVYVSEPFAESVFYECRRECGPVCDFILGARVRGTQRTASGISINFLPSNHDARFAIQVNGNTTAHTTGVTNQATIYTYGRHRFVGKKMITFNSDTFSTHRASLSVWANNKVKSAHMNRQGLLAKVIGNRVAYEMAVKKKPQSDAIAAQRLRSKVLPKFNRELDNTFSDLNQELRDLEARLREASLAPDAKLVRTDTDELRTAYRLMGDDQLAADRPAVAFNTHTGITMHVHESAVNNALAIETYQFNNPVMSFAEFGETLAEKFRQAFQTDKKIDKAEDSGDRLVISDYDPLHLQFEGGNVIVILRVGLRSEGRDPIKLRRVAIPVEIIMEQDTIQFRLAKDEKTGKNLNIIVNPLDPTDERPRAPNNFMRTKLRKKFEERLKDISIDRNFDLPVNNEGDKNVSVRVEGLHAVNGWLVVVLEEIHEQYSYPAEAVEVLLPTPAQ